MHGGFICDTFVCLFFVFDTYLLWVLFIKVCNVFGCRLSEFDLLPLCQMLEATEGPRVGLNDCTKRTVQVDRSLLAALVDRWHL
jgi:hypothetical protein